jgi:hypothetical protein
MIVVDRDLGETIIPDTQGPLDPLDDLREALGSVSPKYRSRNCGRSRSTSCIVKEASTVIE